VRDVARAVAQGAGIGLGPKAGASPRGLEHEIALIRRMVGQMLQTTRGMGAGLGGTMPGALEECYIRLLESEVAAEIADDVVGRVRDELTPVELEDRGVVRQTVLRRLASMIPVHDEPITSARPDDGRPRTIALIGPTGVGKTTTIAKLAATYKLRLRKKVGLVTSDTYRIAAVDQLRTYANIIGLPLEVTLTPTEMTRAVRSLSDCDVILIDTAGRSQHDDHRVQELRSFIDAAQPHERHLVLASTVGESVLKRTASAFSAVDPTHVIFTKLDEAVNFGVLLNVIRSVDARLSFVTTGQEVPDQIERGNADRLARLVLDGGR
jgi:flagellar biosynthesis protein FlhF